MSDRSPSSRVDERAYDLSVSDTQSIAGTADVEVTVEIPAADALPPCSIVFRFDDNGDSLSMCDVNVIASDGDSDRLWMADDERLFVEGDAFDLVSQFKETARSAAERALIRNVAAHLNQ